MQYFIIYVKYTHLFCILMRMSLDLFLFFGDTVGCLLAVGYERERERGGMLMLQD